MRKKIFFILVALSFTLAACASAASEKAFAPAAPAMDMASDFGGGYDDEMMFEQEAVAEE